MYYRVTITDFRKRRRNCRHHFRCYRCHGHCGHRRNDAVEVGIVCIEEINISAINNLDYINNDDTKHGMQWPSLVQIVFDCIVYVRYSTTSLSSVDKTSISQHWCLISKLFSSSFHHSKHFTSMLRPYAYP